MSVHVTLTPQLEKFVQDKVKSGQYATPSEVLRESVRIHMAEEERRKEMDRRIDESTASLRAGKGIPDKQAIAQMKAWTDDRKRGMSGAKAKKAA